jgi:hypothetical protein
MISPSFGNDEIKKIIETKINEADNFCQNKKFKEAFEVLTYIMKFSKDNDYCPPERFYQILDSLPREFQEEYDILVEKMNKEMK